MPIGRRNCMKTEEAITILEQMREGILDPTWATRPLLIDERAEALMAGIEALKKQIPAEPLYEYDGYADGAPVIDIAECPSCGLRFYDGDNGWKAECCACGQKLDWSAADLT